MKNNKNNFLHFATVVAVFVSNILIIVFDQGVMGFGKIYLAFLGVILTYLGLAFWFFGFISLGSSFALLTKTNKLVTSGLYKYFKHPIYIGIFLTFTGIAVAKGAIFALLFNLFITTPLNYLRAKNEEKELSRKFSQYKKK